MQATERTHPELDSPREVLAFVRTRRADANAAELDVLTGVITWAEQHPPESIYDTAAWPGYTTWAARPGSRWPGRVRRRLPSSASPSSGPPWEFSTDAARAWVAHGIELKHRLPARLRGPRPPGRTGRAARPHLRLPWCARPARTSQKTHPSRPAAGTTCSRNIASLGRRHHRLKTPLQLDLHDDRTRHLSSGPAPTATSSSATTPAPSTSRPTGRHPHQATHPTVEHASA